MYIRTCLCVLYCSSIFVIVRRCLRADACARLGQTYLIILGGFHITLRNLFFILFAGARSRARARALLQRTLSIHTHITTTRRHLTLHRFRAEYARSERRETEEETELGTHGLMVLLYIHAVSEMWNCIVLTTRKRVGVSVVNTFLHNQTIA